MNSSFTIKIFKYFMGDTYVKKQSVFFLHKIKISVSILYLYLPNMATLTWANQHLSLFISKTNKNWGKKINLSFLEE